MNLKKRQASKYKVVWFKAGKANRPIININQMVKALSDGELNGGLPHVMNEHQAMPDAGLGGYWLRYDPRASNMGKKN